MALRDVSPGVGPEHIDVGPDGNYYVADNQSFVNPDYKSRLLRLRVKDGMVVGCDVTTRLPLSGESMRTSVW